MASESTFDDLKKLGNELFVKNEYEKAIECYSKALSIQPRNHLGLSNRSACYLQLGKYEDAHVDAVECVALAPNFARGFLRKASALNKLKKFEEAMVSAEKGFCLRGSDKICKDCVLEWLEASHALMEKGVAKLEECISGVQPLTDKCLLVLLQLEQLNNGAGVSIEDLFSLLVVITDELDALLQRFGHRLSPCLNLWISALKQAIKIDPRTHLATPSAVKNMTKYLNELVSWLDSDVDHLLYPIIRPIFGLFTLCMLTCAATLSQAISFRSSVQLLTNVCLVFFRVSVLSGLSEYNRLHIHALQTLLNSYCMETGQGFRKQDEKQKEKIEVQSLVKELKSLIEKYSSSNAMDCAEVITTAKLVIENAMELISPSDNVLPSKRLTSSDLGLLKSQVAQEIQNLTSDTDLNFRDMDTLILYTGGLVHLKEIECAKVALRKSEQCYLSVLIKLLQRKLLKLDDIAECIFHPTIMMISNALYFTGVDDSLLANVVITWKSLATELYSLFARLGVKDSLLNVFNRVMLQKKMGKGIEEDSLLKVTDQHYTEVGEIVKKWSVKVVEGLFEHSWEKIQAKLSSNQIFLQYCMCPLYDTDCYPVPIPPKVIKLSGVLVAILNHGEPIVKAIDFRKIQNLALESHDKSMKAVAAKLAGKDWQNLQIDADKIGSELLEIILPSDLQITLMQNKIECIYFCPDQLLSKFPIEILRFNDGKRLGEKFAVSYLSSAHEILRESTYQTLLNTNSAATVLNTASNECSNKCLIFGNPNFDLQKDESQISSIADWSSLGSLLSSFFSSATENTTKAQPLPLSENEADEIEYLLSSVKLGEEPCRIEKFVGDTAHLTNALSVHRPLILHFATHGFSSPDFHYQYRNFWSDTKSGILLAGANTYRLQKYHAIVDEAGTGELSALAVCGLDLMGTRLVYLSTCRSSYGFVGRGESLSSLAQAFRIAGSQTVIATLWPTPDDIARKLALHFYSHVKQGLRPSLALMAAKKTLREDDSYNHWYNWAGFICIGIDNPIFV